MKKRRWMAMGMALVMAVTSIPAQSVTAFASDFEFEEILESTDELIPEEAGSDTAAADDTAWNLPEDELFEEEEDIIMPEAEGADGLIDDESFMEFDDTMFVSDDADEVFFEEAEDALASGEETLEELLTEEETVDFEAELLEDDGDGADPETDGEEVIQSITPVVPETAVPGFRVFEEYGSRRVVEDRYHIAADVNYTNHTERIQICNSYWFDCEDDHHYLGLEGDTQSGDEIIAAFYLDNQPVNAPLDYGCIAGKAYQVCIYETDRYPSIPSQPLTNEASITYMIPEAIDTIELGKEETGTLNQAEVNWYSFIPEESGYYAVVTDGYEGSWFVYRISRDDGQGDGFPSFSLIQFQNMSMPVEFYQDAEKKYEYRIGIVNNIGGEDAARPYTLKVEGMRDIQSAQLTMQNVWDNLYRMGSADFNAAPYATMELNYQDGSFETVTKWEGVSCWDENGEAYFTACRATTVYSDDKIELRFFDEDGNLIDAPSREKVPDQNVTAKVFVNDTYLEGAQAEVPCTPDQAIQAASSDEMSFVYDLADGESTQYAFTVPADGKYQVHALQDMNGVSVLFMRKNTETGFYESVTNVNGNDSFYGSSTYDFNPEDELVLVIGAATASYGSLRMLREREVTAIRLDDVSVDPLNGNPYFNQVQDDNTVLYIEYDNGGMPEQKAELNWQSSSDYDSDKDSYYWGVTDALQHEIRLYLTNEEGEILNPDNLPNGYDNVFLQAFYIITNEDGEETGIIKSNQASFKPEVHPGYTLTLNNPEMIAVNNNECQYAEILFPEAGRYQVALDGNSGGVKLAFYTDKQGQYENINNICITTESRVNDVYIDDPSDRIIIAITPWSSDSFNGWLTISEASDLDPYEVDEDTVIALSDGYQGDFDFDDYRTEYFSYSPDVTARYQFRTYYNDDESAEQAGLKLYQRISSGYKLAAVCDSDWEDENEGGESVSFQRNDPPCITYTLQAGREYLFALNAYWTNMHVSFGQPDKAEAFSLDVPQTMGLFTAPGQLKNVAVTVTYEKAGQISLTNWKDYLLDGVYCMRTQADPDNETYYLLARQNENLVSMSSYYSEYDGISTGEITFELCTRDDTTGELKERATDTSTIVMEENIPVLEPAAGEQPIQLTGKTYKVWQLAMPENGAYNLSGEIDNLEGVKLFTVSEDENRETMISTYTSEWGSYSKFNLEPVEEEDSNGALYLVLYAAHDTTGSLYFNKKSRIAKAELTETSRIPQFIEGLYGYRYYWDAQTVSLKLTYEDGGAELIRWTTEESHEITTKNGDTLELVPYRLNSENNDLEIAWNEDEEYFYADDWAPTAGTYYAVIMLDETPLRKEGTGEEEDLTPENTVCVPFTVVTKAEAVSGHELTAREEPYAMESIGGYYVGVSFTAQQAESVTIDSDVALDDVRAFDGENGMSIYSAAKKLSDFRYQLIPDKGQTLHVFIRPSEAGNFNITVSEAGKVESYEIFAAGSTNRTEGIDDTFTAGDFGVKINYDNGTISRVIGSEKDAYGNRYSYELQNQERLNGTTLHASRQYTIKPGTYNAFAFGYTSGGYYSTGSYYIEGEERSTNSIQVVVSPAEHPDYASVEEGEIAKLTPGNNAFTFTPDHKGLYRFLNEEGIPAYVQAKDENGEIAQGSMRMYALEAGKTYTVRPTDKPETVRYLNPREISVTDVTDGGAVLPPAEDPDSKYVVFRTNKTATCTISTQAGSQNTDFYTELYQIPDSENVYSSGKNGKSIIQQTLYPDTIYILSIRTTGNAAGSDTFTVRISEETEKPVRLELRSDEAASFPITFAEEFLSEGHAYLDEVYADGHVNSIPTGYVMTGETGIQYSYDTRYDYWNEENENTLDVDIYSAPVEIPFTAKKLTFSDGYDLPALLLEQENRNGKPFGDKYYYRFTAPKDGAYTILLSSETEGIVQTAFSGPGQRDYSNGERLSKGETVIVQAFAAKEGIVPGVTVLEIPEVTNIEILSLPDVILHQTLAEDDLDGTVQVTYSNGAVQTYPLNNFMTDLYGYQINLNVNMIPVGENGKEKVRVSVSVGNRCAVQVVELTDPSVLPEIAEMNADSSEADYNSIPKLTEDQAGSVWYRFTPSEDGWYMLQMLGDVRGFNSYYMIYEGNSTTWKTEPFKLEKNKEYLVHFGMNRMGDATFDPDFAVCMYHVDPENEGALAKHAITYRAVLADGTPVTDEEILALMPESRTYYSGSVLKVRQPSKTQTTTDLGSWEFIGYDVMDETVEVADEDIVITGTWKLTSNVHTVHVVFASEMEGMELPTGVMQQKPADKLLNKNASWELTPAAGTKVETDDGVWTFSGYRINGETVTAVTMGDTDIEVTGIWSYETKYTITYVYEAMDPHSILLPQIRADKPVNEKVLPGAQVLIKNPAVWSYETENGVWELKPENYTADGDDGITPGSTVTVNRNITVTGKWTYRDEFFDVTYEFAADEGTLPQEVIELTPDSVSVKKGTMANAVRPDPDQVEADGKVWTFTGYDKDQKLVTGAGVTFYGTWTHKDICKLTYVFEAEDGTLTLPAVITSMKPADENKVKGSEVTLKRPATETLTDDDDLGTWTFKGYWDEDGNVIENGQVTLNENTTVTGKWEYTHFTCVVTYAFRSATSRKLPDGIRDILPEEQSVTVNKGSDLTLAAPEKTIYDDKADTGKWTFSGYRAEDPEGIPKTVENLTYIREDMTVVGIWTCEDVQFNVRCDFVSGTEGKELPQDQVASLRPANGTILRTGSIARPETPAIGTIVQDGDGYWVFKGYDNGNGADLNNAQADVTFTGTWAYEAVDHRITYSFKNGENSQKNELDPEVLAYKPADQVYGGAETPSPVMPQETRIGMADGSWYFNGYETGFTDSGDVLFTGTWTYKKETHEVTYKFVSADGTVPENEVEELCPAKAVYVKGNVIEQPPVSLDHEVYTVNGTWKLLRYDRQFPVVVGDEDIVITGTWRFEAKAADGEVSAQSALAAVNEGNPSNAAQALSGADNQKIINSFEDASGTQEEAISNMTTFTDIVDDLMGQVSKTVEGADDDHQGGTIKVGATKDGTASIDGDTVTVHMSGAGATVADVINNLDITEEQIYTKDGDNAFSAVVNIEVEGTPEDTSLKMDISLSIVDKNGEKVDTTNEQQGGSLKLAGPVTVTLDIPARYQNKAFKLMHYPNGRDASGVEIPYTWNLMQTAIAFALPSLSPVDIEDVKCRNEEDHVWKVKSRKEAGCMTNGEIVYECENGCVEEHTQILYANGHAWGAWKTSKAATCISDKEEERVCGSCSEKETRTVSGTIDPSAHELAETPAKAATETEAGNIGYYTCRHCGKTFADEKGKTEIDINDTVIVPTKVRDLMNAIDQLGNVSDLSLADKQKVQELAAQLSALGTAAGYVPETYKSKLASAQTRISQLQAAADQAAEDARKEAEKAEAERRAAEKAEADRKAEEARKAAEAARLAEEARKAAEAAKFALNVKNGASVPVLLKKNNKNIHVVKLGEGDSISEVTSSNAAVVKASRSGSSIALKGLKAGKSAKVTVTTTYGGSVTFTVKVQKQASKVKTKSIKMKTTTLAVGETFDITTCINPVTTPDKMKFTLDKKGKKVISVSKKGIIKAKKAGTAKLTIKVGSKKKTVTVKVK